MLAQKMGDGLGHPWCVLFLFLKQSKMLLFSELQNKLLLCLEVLASFRWPVASTSFFFTSFLVYTTILPSLSAVVFSFVSTHRHRKKTATKTLPPTQTWHVPLSGDMCLCVVWKLVLFVTREDLMASCITLPKRCWLHPEVLSLLSPER